jgi:protein arginine kinase activator
MTCEQCGKSKATVHLTEIVNDQISKLNLCEACAKQKGADAEQHFGIADLLAALSEGEAGPAGGAAAAAAAAAGDLIPSKNRCPRCGLTAEDFKKTGRLGCSECYVAFRANLSPLLKRIHGANQHVGKSPNPSAVQDFKVSNKIQEELETAKADLAKAIKKEEFEEAATLRDKVKFLEKKLKDSGK